MMKMDIERTFLIILLIFGIFSLGLVIMNIPSTISKPTDITPVELSSNIQLNTSIISLNNTEANLCLQLIDFGYTGHLYMVATAPTNTTYPPLEVNVKINGKEAPSVFLKNISIYGISIITKQVSTTEEESFLATPIYMGGSSWFYYFYPICWDEPVYNTSINNYVLFKGNTTLFLVPLNNNIMVSIKNYIPHEPIEFLIVDYNGTGFYSVAKTTVQI